MASINLGNVRKSFGNVPILHGIDLMIADGEFTAFVGPSGCGKSTLLRLICGLEEVSEGTVAIDGEIVNDVPPAKRGIAMVFQNYALYPHMSVAENMGYSLRLAGTEKTEIARRVGEAAEALRLTSLLERKPRQLSGGQRQRVAIGRAIVRRPRIFLFDEPLSNLDASLRVDMRAEIATLKARLGTTMVYVTHDQVEAMTLADRIVVMHAGRIEQVGTPLDLYNSPANRFVAGFIGSPRMNMLPAVLDEARHPRLASGVACPIVIEAAPGTAVEIGARAEHLALNEPAARHQLQGEAIVIERLGADMFVHVRIDSALPAVIVRLSGDSPLALGAAVRVTMDADRLHVFGPDGMRLARARNLASAI